MTQRQFNVAVRDWLKEALAKAEDRVVKLRKVQSGDVQLRPIRVKKHTVPEHEVRAHTWWI